jgi:hypothetical protein
MKNLEITAICTMPARWNNGFDTARFAAPCFGGRDRR